MNINKLKEKLLFNIKKVVKNYRTNNSISIEEANQIIANNENTVLIDVRSNQEYKEYHLDGAICIPNYEIQNKIEEEVENKDTIIILYCQSGMRSKKAMEILLEKGYQNVYNIKNGLDE